MLLKKVLIVLVLVSLLFLGCEEAEPEEEKEAPQEEEVVEEEVVEKDPAVIAENWIRENSPTFNERGGSNLEFVSEVETEEKVYEIKFTFETDFAGYGPLENREVTAPVLTSHQAIVLVKNKEVIDVMLNEEYSPLREQRFVEIEEEKLQFLKGVVKREGRDQEVEQRAIREMVFLQLVEEWGIEVTKEDIDQFIMEAIIEPDDYLEERGVTTPQIFLTFMEYERGIPREEVIHEVKVQVRFQKLYEVTKDRFDITKEEMKEEYKRQKNLHEDIPPLEEVQEWIKTEIKSQILFDELERREKEAKLIVK